MQRIVEVSHRDYVIDNGVDEDDALTYPLFSTSTIVIFSIRLPQGLNISLTSHLLLLFTRRQKDPLGRVNKTPTGVTHIPHFSPTPPPPLVSRAPHLGLGICGQFLVEVVDGITSLLHSSSFVFTSI